MNIFILKYFTLDYFSKGTYNSDKFENIDLLSPYYNFPINLFIF
jgi:hypothetical protein